MKTCPIVYENDEILIINKAAGVAVQGGEGVAHPLDDVLSQELGYRVHLVHRLDKETAGLLVIAKTAQAARAWTALIAGKQVKKEYNAVCFNVPVINGKRLQIGESATIRASVEKNGKKQDAITHVTLRKQWAVPAGEGSEMLEFSLLQLTLGTGRMHQLRIHLAGTGSPIVGDDRHGDFKRNKLARKCCGAKLLMLAATRLTVPVTTAAPSVQKKAAPAKSESTQTFSIALPEHIAALVATAPAT